MKPLSLLFFSFLFFADTPRDEITFRYDCEGTELQDNQIFLGLQVSGNPAKVTLNFGQAESALFGKSQMNPVAIENQLFSGNKQFSVSKPDAINCKAPVGYLGYDFFKKSRQIFQLDFDSQSLCCLKALDAEILTEGYEEVKAAFRKDGVYLQVSIRWKNYDLKFDTGFPGTIFMKDADAARFQKETHQRYETSKGQQSWYPNKWITIGSRYYNSPIAVGKAEESKIGVGLLKGFNWIIDFKNQKLFLKKNRIALDSDNSLPPVYKAAIQGDKIVVVSKKANATDFELGDTILSVNDTDVDSQNLCEIEKLLLSTQWGMLKIKKGNQK